MNNKKAVSLPVNVVVMMILGLTIFALGMGLFGKISSSSNAQIDDLQNQIKTNIANLECSDDNFICSPNANIKNGISQTFEVFIVNLDDISQTFNVEFPQEIASRDCGQIDISSPPNPSLNLESGFGGSMPYIINANKVSSTPCSFTAVVKLKDESNNEIASTPMIIKVG